MHKLNRINVSFGGSDGGEREKKTPGYSTKGVGKK